MKTLLFSAVAIALFFGLYAATLRRSNLLRLRRFYLVGTLMVAMVIPFVSIETKAPQATRVSSYVQHIQILDEAPALQIGDTEASPVSIQTETKVETQNAPASWTLKDLLIKAYLIGCAVTFILLIVKLVRTFRYYRRSNLSESLSTWEMRVRILAEPDGNLPFSFLRSVFVNPEVFTDSELRQVLCHERAHIRQHHTVDLLLLEAVKVFQWFNPLMEEHMHFAYHRAGQFVAIDRMLFDSAFFSDPVIELLNVSGREGRQLFLSEKAFDLIFRKHPVSVQRAFPDGEDHIFIQPFVEPFAECHPAFFGKIDVPVDVNHPV